MSKNTEQKKEEEIEGRKGERGNEGGAGEGRGEGEEGMGGEEGEQAREKTMVYQSQSPMQMSLTSLCFCKQVSVYFTQVGIRPLTFIGSFFFLRVSGVDIEIQVHRNVQAV